MPTLQIHVIDPPRVWADYERIDLVLSVGDACFPPAATGESDLRFDVPIEIRPDKSGVLQGWGPAVVRQNDGRRFIYLSWVGRQGLAGVRFRRLKVFLDKVPGFHSDAETLTVRVKGKDPKGGPACATAVVI